jgi:hypothetical protein
MLGGLISLASYGLGTGGDIGNALFQLEQMGVFAYLLPFLLIFALVYGILSNTNILGNNKGINVVLAVAIGLMALQFNFVSYFFSEIFPRLGVGLAILLVIVVLLSAFVDLKTHPKIKWVFGIVGALIALIIIFQSLGSSFGFLGSWGFNTWGIGYFFQRNSWIIPLAVVIAIVVAITRNKSPDNEKKKE